MNATELSIVIDQLLNEEEGATLDFKQEQYRYSKAPNDEKSEMLKDLLAFANAFRRTDAYILVGVRDRKGGRAELLGISDDLDDAHLQQFVNGKTTRTLEFSYQAHTFEGVKIGVFRIPLQERPVYLKQDFGKLKKDTVYIRRGSSTAEATPDEIARMGRMAVVEMRPDHQPELQLRFVDGSDRCEFTIEPFDPSTEKTIPEMMEEYRQQYPLLVYKAPTAEKPASDNTLAAVLAGLASALNSVHAMSEEKIKQYNAHLNIRYQEYEKYLKKKVEYDHQQRGAVTISLQILNVGTLPANDVDIKMHFPDGFEILSKLLREPRIPDPPVAPRDFSEFGMLFQGDAMRALQLPGIANAVLNRVPGPEPNVSSLSIRKTNSYDVRCHVNRVKHNQHAPIDPVHIRFARFEDVQPFTIDYTLQAANVPQEVKGSLYVDVVKG